MSKFGPNIARSLRSVKELHDPGLIPCRGILIPVTLGVLEETNLVDLVRTNHSYLFRNPQGTFHNIQKAM